MWCTCPSDIVLLVVPQLYAVNEVPESDKLRQVCGCKTRSVVEVSDPSITLKCLRHRPFLFICLLEQKRGNVSGSATLDPPRGPKRGFVAVAQGDFGTSREKQPVLIVAGNLGAHPRFFWRDPLVPKPT